MDIFLPIQLLANWISFTLFNLSKESVLGGAVNFFIYDSIKIFILLCVIIFIVTYVRSYLPPEKIKKLLTKRFQIVGNILAALIGIITPFCSCSAVPLFIGFVESGVPLGVTFSYLISAPMVNEVAAVLLLGLFGIKVAIIYILSGVLIAVIVGYILGKMKLEHLVEDYVWKIKAGDFANTNTPTFNERRSQAYQYTSNLVKKVFPYVLLGVGLGSIIHGYAPENFLTKIAGKNNLLAVPLAVAIGVPLYSNAAGTIPIVKSLIEKGLPLGTSLAFMMAIAGLSLPEGIILKKVMSFKLLFTFFGIVGLGIMIIGYLFNFLEVIL